MHRCQQQIDVPGAGASPRCSAYEDSWEPDDEAQYEGPEEYRFGEAFA
ncbi:hypothetical protein [Streptomyces erythrochromogenes]|nr:hypothetical protein OG364_38415 [Streptomyces erythrochromogenes]